jgi:hypothetical protein
MPTPSESLYREIQLTRGMVALVDAEDYEELSQYSWHARRNPTTGLYYAARTTPHDKNGRQLTVRMHRQILGLEPGDPRQADHKEPMLTLDNRRSVNLRIATWSENMRNRRKSRNNKSGHKGVSWSKEHQKWQATIHLEGKNRFLGRFVELSSAAEAYRNAAIENFGEFARVC